MEQYVIKGGQPLEGEVTIAGAKNAALGILAAAVMTDQEVIIENVPNVRDIRIDITKDIKVDVDILIYF